MSVWGMVSRMARRLGVGGRSGPRADSPYRSPKEIALQNAADSLGVTLGDYYPEDPEVSLDPKGSLVGGSAARLEASREEMLVYIATQRARRRRRWLRVVGASVMLVALVSVGVLVGAASRSNVPNREAWGDRAQTMSPTEARGIGVPSSRQTTASAELSIGRKKKVVASAYVDRRGGICLKVANVVAGVIKTYGVGGCMPFAFTARKLARKPAVQMGSSNGWSHILVSGFAREDVRTLLVRRPTEGGQVAISGPWVPPDGARAGSKAVRIFLIRFPFKSRRTDMDVLRGPTLPGAFEFAAVFSNGRIQRVGRMWDRGRVRRFFDPIIPRPAKSS